MFTKFTRIGLFALLTLWATWTTLGAEPPTNWMGFRNQTGTTLILQETFANGRQGAAQKVFANETFRDTPPANAVRKFTIYNAKELDKPLYTGSFAGPTSREHVLYILKSDGKNGLAVEILRIPATPLAPVKKK